MFFVPHNTWNIDKVANMCAGCSTLATTVNSRMNRTFCSKRQFSRAAISSHSPECVTGSVFVGECLVRGELHPAALCQECMQGAYACMPHDY